MPMCAGSTPADALGPTKAIGVSPSSLALFSSTRSSAAAPSLTPEELPAVTVPKSSSANMGRSLPSFSRVMFGRGCSSVSTMTGSRFGWGIETGVISLLKSF